MSCQIPTGGSAADAKLRGSPRKEQNLRNSAILHQQRRLKQATQFLHKDSADLLPLDQLRRLGTSKDLQPHNVIQRRLLGGSPVKETSSLAKPLPPCDQGSPTGLKSCDHETPTGLKSCDADTTPVHQAGDQLLISDPPEETAARWKEESLLIPCQVCAQDVFAKVCTERPENLISKSCAQKLGLETRNGPPERLRVDIGLGCETLTADVVIVDDGSAELCIGLETLVSLKSCIDLEHGVLKTPTQVIPFLTALNNHPMAAKKEAGSNSSQQ